MIIRLFNLACYLLIWAIFISDIREGLIPLIIIGFVSSFYMSGKMKLINSFQKPEIDSIFKKIYFSMILLFYLIYLSVKAAVKSFIDVIKSDNNSSVYLVKKRTILTSDLSKKILGFLLSVSPSLYTVSIENEVVHLYNFDLHGIEADEIFRKLESLLLEIFL